MLTKQASVSSRGSIFKSLGRAAIPIIFVVVPALLAANIFGTDYDHVTQLRGSRSSDGPLSVIDLDPIGLRDDVHGAPPIPLHEVVTGVEHVRSLALDLDPSAIAQDWYNGLTPEEKLLEVWNRMTDDPSCESLLELGLRPDQALEFRQLCLEERALTERHFNGGRTKNEIARMMYDELEFIEMVESGEYYQGINTTAISIKVTQRIFDVTSRSDKMAYLRKNKNILNHHHLDKLDLREDQVNELKELWEEFRNEHVKGIHKFEREAVRMAPVQDYAPLTNVKPSTVEHIPVKKIGLEEFRNEHVKGINKFEREAVMMAPVQDYAPLTKVKPISVEQLDFDGPIMAMNVLEGENEFDDNDLEGEMAEIDPSVMNGGNEFDEMDLEGEMAEIDPSVMNSSLQVSATDRSVARSNGNEQAMNIRSSVNNPPAPAVDTRGTQDNLPVSASTAEVSTLTVAVDTRATGLSSGPVANTKEVVSSNFNKRRSRLKKKRKTSHLPDSTSSANDHQLKSPPELLSETAPEPERKVRRPIENEIRQINHSAVTAATAPAPSTVESTNVPNARVQGLNAQVTQLTDPAADMSFAEGSESATHAVDTQATGVSTEQMKPFGSPQDVINAMYLPKDVAKAANNLFDQDHTTTLVEANQYIIEFIEKAATCTDGHEWDKFCIDWSYKVGTFMNNHLPDGVKCQLGPHTSPNNKALFATNYAPQVDADNAPILPGSGDDYGFDSTPNNLSNLSNSCLMESLTNLPSAVLRQVVRTNTDIGEGVDIPSITAKAAPVDVHLYSMSVPSSKLPKKEKDQFLDEQISTKYVINVGTC